MTLDPQLKAYADQLAAIGAPPRHTLSPQAVRLTVAAEPAEATALGNALMQLVGLGEARTLAEIRAIAQQAPTRVFTPRADQRAAWDEAAGRFAALTPPPS
jgi:sugar (pentulose or hexulose) kinase